MRPTPTIPDVRAIARTRAARALTAWRDIWSRWTIPYDPSHLQAAQFRSLQVQSTLTLTPWVLLANWANIGVIGWSFRHEARPALLTAWMLVTAVTAAAGISAWRIWRTGRWPARNSTRTLHRIARHAAVLAALWALPMAAGYSSADAAQRPLLLAIAVGMICAGGFALAAVPRAAIVYVVVLAAGVVAGFIRAGGAAHALLLLLCVVYAGIVLVTVVISSRQMGGRLVAEADSARQKRLVDLLLDDFQENARDWLWEISADGRLRHASLRLAEAFGLPLDAIDDAPLAMLIRRALAPASAEAQQAIDTLDRALARATAFRDLHVPVVVSGRQRWWSLTGKRLFDDQGQPAGWRGVGTDVTRSREYGDELARLANFDTLTGLANRHQFHARMTAAAGRPFTLYYLDLDDFKSINDLHGHLVGDETLKIVTRRFQSVISAEDLLARIGGDEFALLCWTADPDAAADTAQRLIDSLREPIAIDGLTLRVGTCVGIVPAGGSDSPIGGLTRLADMALYAAKAAGSNTFRFFEGTMEEAARRRLSLLGDLHGAAHDGQLELRYQPLIDFATGRVAGAEALMRWRHPQRGLLSPAEFIPLAEESGLIVPMGQWALREACRQALDWPTHMRVAVNMSAMQFASVAFVAELQALLDETGLAPHRLELEITESLLIDDSAATRATLDALRDLGVRIALDDFGTGYSSLAYLRSFPFDALKIDGAFVRSLNGDSESLAVIRAIVQLARALRMDVTAEGIETWRQYEALCALGCTDAQGHVLGRPMTADELAAWLDDWQLPVREFGGHASVASAVIGRLKAAPTSGARPHTRGGRPQAALHREPIATHVGAI